MISLDEAKKKLNENDYKYFEDLYYTQLGEEHLSPQWYTTREMMQQILKKNNLADEDPFDLGVD